ncbi:MAG: hypothetical protein K2Y71_12000 [Xanthobacteraceae bacterium]|nr:hypothetical protein [Xanthobacteraceae bacterium]
MTAISQAKRFGAVAAALLLAATLAGCSSTSVIDNVPHSMGGLPEGVPARPAAPPAYPAVHDLPPPRTDSALSDVESKRLREDLKNTRNRVAPASSQTTGAAGGARNP